jgi:nicotinate-nucleotide adenylyltransferase
MNVGILGGTFDPPHIGHLVIGDQALTELGLDEIWFTPVGQPPHKRAAQVSEAAHRVAMTRLAIATHPRFRVCERDVERPGPHYSLTLMQLLRAEHPRHTWTFIIGEDSLADLPDWHKPAELLALTRLAIARRPDSTPDLAAIRAVVPGIDAQLNWIDAPLMDLSSTELRDRLRAGRSVRYLVPRAVAEYATQNGLYSQS